MKRFWLSLLGCTFLALMLLVPSAFAAPGIDVPSLTEPATYVPADKAVPTDTASAPKRVELVLVLDKSGSMSGLESDTIGGFNSMIEKEKKLDADIHVTTVLFSNDCKLLYDRQRIQAIPPMKDKEYEVGGSTALLDAVGSTILKVDKYEDVAQKDKDTKVLFVIITDGMENASSEFTKAKVKEMISDRQEKQGWEFVYLGANIDAAKEAGSIGINKENAVKYKNTGRGVLANFDALSTFVSERANDTPAEKSHWKEQVEQDS